MHKTEKKGKKKHYKNRHINKWLSVDIRLTFFHAENNLNWFDYIVMFV